MLSAFETLSRYIEAPELWQRSEAPFWDDEYISEQMLAAHLSPNTDAASRKETTICRSVEWLSGILQKSGRILDLGCGPGLYARRLSALGYEVTGVDLSHRSISYAKEYDVRTSYKCQNYLELKEINRYDGIIMIYCDYGALTLSERKILLNNAFRSLKSGGVFVFDVFTDIFLARQTWEKTWKYCPRGGFYSPKSYVLLEAAYPYENHTVRAERHTVITEDIVTDHIIWNTVYTPERLLEEIQFAGFRLCGTYDDVCGAEYTEKSETLGFVVMKP